MDKNVTSAGFSVWVCPGAYRMLFSLGCYRLNHRLQAETQAEPPPACPESPPVLVWTLEVEKKNSEGNPCPNVFPGM